MVGYRRFMELDPKNAQIRYEAAQILIDGGKLEEARRELTQALALEPKLAAARNALGVLALRRGDLAAAEREIRAAIEEKADVRLAHYQSRAAGGAAGRSAAGDRRVQKRNRAAREQLQGGFNLGRLYEQRRRSAGAARAVPAGDRDEPELC